jgi:hypothetical protein
MRGPIRSILLAALAVCAFAAIPAAQASAATIEDEATAMLAIYGNPGTNGTALPVGGGLGRNFGFGKNMLFQACSGCTNVPAIGENLKITLAGSVSEAKDSYIGGRLMSNKTGVNNPLSFKIEFVDFQDNLTGGVATPSYADTSDRPWIAEICSPAAEAKKCKPDAQFPGAEVGGVKIDDVTFLLVTAGGPVVVQGAVWGEWEGTKPPCIKLEKPAAGNPTLVVTQTFAGGPVLGEAITAISGKACLISANNDWYNVKAGEVKEPATTIANT